jgi:hypothetical protein
MQVSPLHELLQGGAHRIELGESAELKLDILRPQVHNEAPLGPDEHE